MILKLKKEKEKKGLRLRFVEWCLGLMVFKTLAPMAWTKHAEWS